MATDYSLFQMDVLEAVFHSSVDIQECIRSHLEDEPLRNQRISR